MSNDTSETGTQRVKTGMAEMLKGRRDHGRHDRVSGGLGASMAGMGSHVAAA